MCCLGARARPDTRFSLSCILVFVPVSTRFFNLGDRWLTEFCLYSTRLQTFCTCGFERAPCGAGMGLCGGHGKHAGLDILFRRALSHGRIVRW